MQFCHWCSKKIKQGRFCGSECLQAAAEMPELINHKYLDTPAKVYSKRRIALGVVGALALIGGSIAAMWPAPEPTPVVVVQPFSCAYPSLPMEPTPILVQAAKAPVSAFIYTNTTVARTSEIDALVQSTLPQLQALYSNMALNTNDGSAPSGLLELSFLIQQDGSVKWVSRVGNSFSPLLDSVAIKSLQQLHFNESPLRGYTTLSNDPMPVYQEVEVKVMYRFGDGSNTNRQNQQDIMPYFEDVTR